MVATRTFADELIISPSCLKLLDACPRSWAYKYLLGLPAEEGIPARLVLGSACHEALALYYTSLRDGLPEPSPEAMFEAAASYIQRAQQGPVPIVFEDGDGPDELIAEAVRLLRVFVAAPYRPTRVLEVEWRFSVDLVEPTTGEVLPFEERLSGFMDLVVEDEGELVVIDHKIRKRAEPPGPADLQLAAYAIAAEMIYGRPAKVRHLNLIGTKVPRVAIQEFELGDQEKSEAIESIVAGLELVHLAVVHDAPLRLLGRRRSWRCSTCSYKNRCKRERL